MRKLLLAALLFSTLSKAQSIIYSPIENDNIGSTQYEILGKYNNNYLIYKSYIYHERGFSNKIGSEGVNTIKEEIIRHHINVYDRQMNLIATENLSLPGYVVAVHFISYKNFCYLFYQYLHGAKLYCMAVKINEQGKITGDPVQLTVTDGVDYSSVSKMYNIICSEDKKTIAVVKVAEKTSSHLINFILFDEQLNKIKENAFEIPRRPNSEILSEFKMDNSGNIVFLSSSYPDKIVLNLIKRDADSVLAFDLSIKNIDLVNPKLEINNAKNIYRIFSFYFVQGNNHTKGIISETWSLDSQTILSVYNTTLGNKIREEACSNCSVASALDNFFIQNIFLQKDGSVLVESENIYNGFFSKLAYQQFYSDYTSPYLSFDEKKQAIDAPWFSKNGFSQNTIDKNILLTFYDSVGRCDTVEVIPKFQKDYERLLGSFVMNTGDAIEFIYSIRRRGFNYEIERASISSNKKIKFYPSIKDSISSYRFTCRFGKQVSANEVIIPGIYQKQVVFGKIDKIDSQ